VARPRTRRASVKAAAPARKIPAWLEGQPHWRRRGAMAGGVHERREAVTLT
jgi:hypothetical protein